MKDDIRVKYDALANTIKNIENSINNIEITINNVQKAMLSLDENKWKSQQKDKIDSEFMPYLKTISTDYPAYLKEEVAYLKNAVVTYQLLDQRLQLIVEKGQ